MDRLHSRGRQPALYTEASKAIAVVAIEAVFGPNPKEPRPILVQAEHTQVLQAGVSTEDVETVVLRLSPGRQRQQAEYKRTECPPEGQCGACLGHLTHISTQICAPCRFTRLRGRLKSAWAASASDQFKVANLPMNHK